MAAHVRKKLQGREQETTPAQKPRRRTDVRLGLPALLVWGAAVAGAWLSPVLLALLCSGLLVLATALLARSFRGGKPRATRRSFLTTTSVALVLAAAAAAHSAVSSSQRHDGPFAEAAAAGKSVVAVLEITGPARALTLPGQAGTPERWSVAARTEEVTVGGTVIRTRAELLVMGARGWDNVVPGQLVRAAGKLRPPEPGQQEAAILSASMAPAASGAVGADAALAGEVLAKQLRGRYVAASSFLAADARGLLPGMVTGDTSALDEGLSAAMKTVGMTHLTAVSGANCSLVLGALLMAARSLRVPRVPAAGLALAGLGMFVVLVSPDASVLRAALMGSIALASLAGGRVGRGLSYLCLAVMGLLLADPGLATSFGFLLSVLATLGIIVLGPRIMDWTPAVVPRWAAAALAVPLSAQLLCGPVIVLLQPQFSTYALPANMVAAPLVAPVTLLGTAAVPLVAWAPWLATALIAVAGTFSAGVAGTARTAAGLPGSVLPWPEGGFGLLTMVLFSVLTLAALWGAARPREALRMVLGLHARTVGMLNAADNRFQALSVLYWRPSGSLRNRSRFGGGGLEARVGRGRLRHCTRISGRNPPWPQPKPPEPNQRRPMWPPGGT
ncbi:ComEC/Rec2 family competence protein [Pseudarthrobacter sp. H3Y2-7]|uniref:ComEC/Rec2 family competence protein n=1 Tax=Pseudarthrobacter naphthalenicus TaxID=3031328 RepID=UPI0023B1E26F|nr:ComEC/Rec2 family competence protein [Pseudarthrobacter sp. H3Y2-7]MDE8668946.1 ComEC/Rec2 family competence protein [Pseudarthrobacter sp. H3Y2-7]